MANKFENLVFILLLFFALIAGFERSVLLVGMLVFFYLGLLCICCLLLFRKKRLQPEDRDIRAEEPILDELQISDVEKGFSDLKLFSFASIMAATDKFSVENKLGQGGFGLVYKGKLPVGNEIAVKRLLQSSCQGLHEFKNELILIRKLQHRNLVKLLGYCVKGDEKMLIYEYMPNKSLDFYLFDPTRSELLDWKKRYNIIEGIAQGLLYLHKYSRLPIIHRDLKSSNILLDIEMNPKISDFGTAKIFNRNKLEANTLRIVGTYGYMSPEYAMEGRFSDKSDIYSFGILLLEIVSGRKINSEISSPEELPSNLVGYAWELWKEGRSTELIDPMLSDQSTRKQIGRCIHVALLCIQDDAAKRPTMSDVVLMITNETLPLPHPKKPMAVFTRQKLKDMSNSVSGLRKQEACSINEASISEMNQPR